MKKMIAVLMILAAVSLSTPAGTAWAQDDGMPIIFRDTLYGAATGAFLGGLLLLTSDNAGNHWDYVAFGGLIGAAGGLAYGVYNTPRSMVEIDKGRITVGLPTIQTANISGSRDKEYLMDLLKFQY